jgi:hypothetical protein
MTTTDTSQTQRMRALADVLDSLPGLPPLYIVFSSSSRGSVDLQVPEHLPLTDAERMAVADRLAAAFGLECSERHRKDDGSWIYGTAFGSEPAIYTPGVTDEPS